MLLNINYVQIIQLQMLKNEYYPSPAEFLQGLFNVNCAYVSVTFVIDYDGCRQHCNSAFLSRCTQSYYCCHKIPTNLFGKCSFAPTSISMQQAIWHHRTFVHLPNMKPTSETHPTSKERIFILFDWKVVGKIRTRLKVVIRNQFRIQT